ncbi:MAG TPA: SDR family oxidoreductase [Candidatus Dormibacteraeota bacterium]|nr:SDR family oxidoreductase [Candidatus Dormibacteraeota bacterium]
MLIAQGRLAAGALDGWVVVVTGAGGGIGFEAARSLLWLGATVVIAEIDVASGREAEARLAAEWTAPRVAFVPADVGDEASVRHLVQTTVERFGVIDAVVNNATYAPVGKPVAEIPISDWDRSYAVNLRGPAMLAAAVLPGMIARRRGVFACVSSTGGPFLAAYESLKAAQVALASSLDAELDGTGVIAFTIGPGLVPTTTASRAVELLAPKLGMSVDEFWKVNAGAVLPVEAAGAGFAAAVAMAERYGGQEISSSQALIDAGIDLDAKRPVASHADAGDSARSRELARHVHDTLAEQAEGWKQRSFFERQWMLRDFKQHVGVPVERCLEELTAVDMPDRKLLMKLAGFYDHMSDLARGYVKDPVAREQQLQVVAGWKHEVEELDRR